MASFNRNFIKRTFNGEKLEDNIRLIGACNPYRRKIYSTEKFGITREFGDEDDRLLYKVDQKYFAQLFHFLLLF